MLFHLLKHQYRNLQITKLSTILAKYLPFLQLQVVGFQT